MKKELIAGFLLIVLFINIVSAVEVVQVQPSPEQKKGFWQGFKDTVFSPLFLGIIFFLILIAVIIIALFFIVKWIIKYFKSQNDLFFRIKQERIKMSKAHKRYKSKHWWKVYKNTPIRLVKRENNKLIISNPIAYHRGDYTTHDGNVIISCNMLNNKKYFVFPITDVLIIPNKATREITELEDKTRRKIKRKIENIPTASDIVQFNENDILLFAESISRVGLFLIPVLKSKDGKILDLSIPTYQALKEVAIEEMLFHQTNDFADVTKKAISMNPNAQYQIKTQDLNQSTDIPSSNS